MKIKIKYLNNKETEIKDFENWEKVNIFLIANNAVGFSVKKDFLKVKSKKTKSTKTRKKQIKNNIVCF